MIFTPVIQSQDPEVRELFTVQNCLSSNVTKLEAHRLYQQNVISSVSHKLTVELCQVPHERCLDLSRV